MPPRRHLLIVSHAPTANTRALTDAVAEGAADPEFGSVDCRVIAPLEAGVGDVRSADADALARGAFRVVELNGISAEATHIYDPRYGPGHAVRTLCRQWERALAIASANRRRGVRPTSYRALAELALRRLRR